MQATVNQAPTLEVDEARSRLRFWLRLDAARLLWPSRCLACDAPGLDSLDLCAACAAALPWNRCACPRCAIPLPAPAPACGACLQRDAALARRGRARPLTEVHAACVYAAPIDRLLPRFKFHHDLAAGRLLAQLMAETCALLPRPDALLPLPLHRARLRRRGYDQALELAKPLARVLELPLLDGALIRIRNTAPQSRLDATQRHRNLRGAFALRGGAALPAHVVLVDDVMTTGATLHAAATALRRAGVARVDAWVCARVP
ncbi:MAG TPA: double zinc ribbon domain-containing protein [Lysobacter sp.]